MLRGAQQGQSSTTVKLLNRLSDPDRRNVQTGSEKSVGHSPPVIAVAGVEPSGGGVFQMRQPSRLRGVLRRVDTVIMDAAEAQ